MRSEPPGRITASDVIAGASVALILIPQSMAYAELAGLPSHHGLYAASVPLIAAALLASSPYLQTGPVALTGLLTLGALSALAPTGTAEYAALAALLALVVGVARMAVGFFRMGWLVYLMSRPMMTGFLSAAAILILSSQLPGAVGVDPAAEGVLPRAWAAVSDPGSWDVAAVGLTLVTIACVLGGRRIHRRVPGVLVAAILGVAYSRMTAYEGAVVGSIPAGLPPVDFDLPWSTLPALIIPGIVISVVGFAEGVSVSRLYASEDRQRWDADREFLSKGMANIAAALTAGFPVGGSLSRTSVNRLAGAKSRWSGLVTGVLVLAFLPFADVLAPLPRAVLSGIVIAAIWSMVRPAELFALRKVRKAQAMVGWSTFVFTLALSPRIDTAILIGIALSIGVHLARELSAKIRVRRDGNTLHVEPSGVLWFASAPNLEDRLLTRLAEEPELERVVIHLGGLGRIDHTGAYTLKEIAHHAGLAQIEVEFEGLPDHARRIFDVVGLEDNGTKVAPPS